MIGAIVEQVQSLISHFSNTLPIEIFVAVGAIIEEIVAPIPSPFVMTLAGSLIESQNRSLVSFLIVAAIGSFFKTIAQWIFYIIADKTEDLASSKFGKTFGFTHADIENVGKYFKGGYKDELIIIATRALPILPSAVVSMVAGFIKVNQIVFIRASLIGNFIRSLFFMAFGYYSFSSYESFSKGFESIENILSVIFLGVAGCVILFILVTRKKLNKYKKKAL